VFARAGQLVQPVIWCTASSALYVFSEHGICVSAEHQWPGAHTSQDVAPSPGENSPAAQASHTGILALELNVPAVQFVGLVDPTGQKDPGGQCAHSLSLCIGASVELWYVPAGHGRGAVAPGMQK
jgi:hypothetical protein